jgi:hypothetical protein
MIRDWSWSLQSSVEVGIWISNLRVGYNPLSPPLNPPLVTPHNIFSSNELVFFNWWRIFKKLVYLVELKRFIGERSDH